MATTPADRAQALGQGKMFEARALNYVGAVREHQRTLGQLLGVAPGREIFVRVPDAEGPEARRRLGYTQRKATIGEWLESQRFHLEAEASLRTAQKDLLLKLLRRQDALRR